MMMAPQIVGVLLKKPGQQSHPRVPPFDPQDTKIRGELYVEDLGERRMVSIRMGWLWVDGTPMNLALRALNLRQASPGICQPHTLALGFTLSNSKGDTLATFWVDSEPIYWSWVRAIAAELVRQTPFRSQRCLNFLEILTICPRGPLPLPDSPGDPRRRSRSELRCWLGDSPLEKNHHHTTTILDDSRRRARSELRCWSSSNSSDEDIVGEFRSIPPILPKLQPNTRTWGCSESSEGSDDSLPWGGNTTSATTITLPEAPTREQRIQRYKEARRRENDARTKRLLEDDAKRRKARAEENNNEVNRYSLSKLKSRYYDYEDQKKSILSIDVIDSPNLRLPSVRPLETTVRFQDQKNFEDTRNNNNLNMSCPEMTTNFSIVRTDSGERRSRARERRNLRSDSKTLQESNESLNPVILSRIPVSNQANRPNSIPRPTNETIEHRERSTGSLSRIGNVPSLLSVSINVPCEEDVARLLERCQRVDHYVPVREKLTLFESLSRMGGRLARSTEDLGRSMNKPSPKGKQRARSLHDLNRGTKALPVREMCRLFEGEQVVSLRAKEQQLSKTSNPPCVRASTRRRNYPK